MQKKAIPFTSNEQRSNFLNHKLKQGYTQKNCKSLLKSFQLHLKDNF